MARDYSPAGQMVVHGTEESLQVGIIKKNRKKYRWALSKK